MLNYFADFIFLSYWLAMHASITVGGSSAVDIVLAVRWSLKWIYFAVRWSIIGNGLTVRWSIIGNSLAVRWSIIGNVLTGRWSLLWTANRFIFPMIDQRKKVPVIRAIISPPNCFRWSINGKKCRSEERSSPRQTVSDDRSTEQSAGQKSDHLPAKPFPMIDHRNAK